MSGRSERACALLLAGVLANPFPGSGMEPPYPLFHEQFCVVYEDGVDSHCGYGTYVDGEFHFMFSTREME